MREDRKNRLTRIGVILLMLLFVVQSSMVVFAAEIDDNYDDIETVDDDDYMDSNYGSVQTNKGTIETNDGDVHENDGAIGTNQGTIYENNGWVDENQNEVQHNVGTIETNDGNIDSNEGEVGTNNGSINSNEGIVETNDGNINSNDGVVETNNGSINSNEALVEKNNGSVNWNEGTVEVNRGYVNNRGNGDDYILFTIKVGDEKTGVVETNYGTVYNSGIVKLNKGRVFNNGGIVENDQGKHYFKVMLKVPNSVSDNAWSYTVDRGFISYKGFDRWLEKNDVGQLTFKLNSGCGWEYDLSAPGDSDGYRAKINDDGTMTIIVDKMHLWLSNVILLIPLKEIESGYDYREVVSESTQFNTITFDLDGGEFTNESGEKETGKVERKYVSGSEITFDEIPEKKGYDFVCWEEVEPEMDETATSESEDLMKESEEEKPEQYKEGDKYIVTKDVEFKAVWKKNI